MKGNFNYNTVFPTEIVQFDPFEAFSGNLFYSDEFEVYSVKEKPPFDAVELLEFLYAEGIVKEAEWVGKIQKYKLKKYSPHNLLFLASICSFNFSIPGFFGVIGSVVTEKFVEQDDGQKINTYGLSEEEIVKPDSKGVPFKRLQQNFQMKLKISYEGQDIGKPLDGILKLIEKIYLLMYGDGWKHPAFPDASLELFDLTTKNFIKIKPSWSKNIFGVKDSANPFATEPYVDFLYKTTTIEEKGLKVTSNTQVFENKNHEFKEIRSNISSKLSFSDESFSLTSKYNFFRKEREKEKFGGTRGSRSEKTFSNIYNDLGYLQDSKGGVAYGDYIKNIKSPHESFIMIVKGNDNFFDIISENQIVKEYPSYLKLSFPVFYKKWKQTDFLGDYENLGNSLLHFSRKEEFVEEDFFNNHLGAESNMLKTANYYFGSYPHIKDFGKSSGYYSKFGIIFAQISANYNNQFAEFLKNTYSIASSNNNLVCSSENAGFCFSRMNIAAGSSERQDYYISYPNTNKNVIEDIVLYDTQVLYDEIYLCSLGQFVFVHGKRFDYNTLLDGFQGNKIVPTSGKIGPINVKIYKFGVVDAPLMNEINIEVANIIKHIYPSPQLYYRENFGISSLADKIPTAPDVVIKHFNGTNKIEVLVDPSMNTYSLTKEKYFEHVLKIKELLPDNNQLNLDEELLNQINAIQQLNKSSKYSDLQKEEKEIVFGFENDIKEHYCILLDESKSIYAVKKDKFSMRFCLEDNKQYYAICFSVDLHNKISPLILFKIKIFNTDSIVFTEIKSIDFNDLFGSPKLLSEEQTFKQFISFSLKDSMKNYNQVDFIEIVKKEAKDSFYLPPETNAQTKATIPQIKLRIKSKKSGRKFDLNVKVEREVIPFFSSQISLSDKLKETQSDSWNVQKLTP